MQETVLLYKIEDTEAGKAIISILKKLEVKVIIVKTKDLMNPVGYTLGLDDFEKSNERIKEVPNDDMIAFAGLDEKQVDIIFEIFAKANIPFIPLKAMIDQVNVEWSFLKLLKAVREEYMHLTGMNKDISML